MSLFFPALYRRRITDVTVADLHRLGAVGLLLDIDNTLTAHDDPTISSEVAAWLKMVQQAGFRPVIVSNNRAERVSPFADRVELPYRAKAAKPLPDGYRSASQMLGIPSKKCVAIGDQIFTDVVGANLAGMPCILLEPILPETQQKFIIFKRFFERRLLSLPSARRKKEDDYANAGIVRPGGEL